MYTFFLNILELRSLCLCIKFDLEYLIYIREKTIYDYMIMKRINKLYIISIYVLPCFNFWRFEF